MEQKNKITTVDIAVTALMIAVVFISNFFRIPIATPLGKTGLHFGNVFCVLSGILLGGTRGGIAAGVGSMLYDFTDAMFISSSPYTLVFKFLMGYTAGTIANANGAEGKKVSRNIIAAICGSLLYVVLYIGKNFVVDYFFMRNAIETVIIACTQKGIVSLFNAVVAVVCSVAFAPMFRKAMVRSGIYNRLRSAH